MIGVSIAIPEPYAGQLQHQRRRFGDANAEAIPPHVTLLPPTPLPTSDLADVEEHLSSVAEAEHGFELTLSGTGTFRPVSPVVFVTLTAGAADCARLEAKVRSGPLAQETTFPYHPHVTVAHDVAEADLDGAFAALAGWTASFRVWGFSMYERGADGVWRPQRDFPFGPQLPGPAPVAQNGS